MFTAAAIVFPLSICAEPFCDASHLKASTPSARFQVQSDTVVDTRTGLMWQKCQYGLDGNTCESGSVQAVNWGEALLQVPVINSSGYGGYSDWRLPNIRELSTLIELQCANPAVNRSVFPGAQGVHIWTSSPYHFYTHYSWYVDFANGAPTYDERTASKGLWLVRDAGQ